MNGYKALFSLYVVILVVSIIGIVRSFDKKDIVRERIVLVINTGIFMSTLVATHKEIYGKNNSQNKDF